MTTAQSTLNEAYRQRNEAALLAAAIAWVHGYAVGYRENPEDPNWPVIVIDLPTSGQVGWHVPTDVLTLLQRQFPPFPFGWDGHTTADKTARINQYFSAVVDVMTGPFMRNRKALFLSILTERERQDMKWGVQDHSPEIWLTILMEEVGEVAERILHANRAVGLDVVLNHERKQYRDELVHVAAVALAALESYDRNEGTW